MEPEFPPTPLNQQQVLLVQILAPSPCRLPSSVHRWMRTAPHACGLAGV